MPKLVESYVEFFAKGIKEVEAQTKDLSESSENAHKAVDILSARFKTLYDKTLKQGIISVDTLFDHQRKIDNLFKKNEGMTKFIVDQQKLEKLQEVFNKTLDLQLIKLKAVDKEYQEISLAEAKLSESIMQANKSLELQTREQMLATGSAKDFMKSMIGLQAQEAALSMQEKKVMANLLLSDSQYQKHTIQIQKSTQAEKLLALESQSLINSLMATDQAFIAMTSNEIKLNQSIEASSKALQLKARQMDLINGDTKQYLLVNKKLAEEEARLVNFESKLNLELMKTDVGFRANIKSIAQSEEATKNNGLALELEISKFKELDATFVKLTADNIKLSQAIDASTKALQLNAREMMLTSGTAKEFMQSLIGLQAQESLLSLKEKKIAVELLKTDQQYQKNAVSIQKATQAEKVLSMESQLLVNKMLLVDKAFLTLTVDEIKMSQAIDATTRTLQLNAKQFMLTSGATLDAIKADRAFLLEESKLATKIAEVNTNLIKSNPAFAGQTLAIKQANEQQKLYEMQADLVVAKMAAMSKESITLMASQMVVGKEIEQEAKKIDLLARSANIANGSLRKLLDAQVALEKQEKKIAKREANQQILAQYGTIIGSLKIMRDSMKFFEDATKKALSVTLQLAIGVAKIGGRGIMAAAGYVANKFKRKPQADMPAKIAIDTSDAPKAEKFLDRIREKLGKLQTFALVAGGAIGGYVGYFTSAASAGTIEADKLGQAYEYAGRIIGDMFAPYVRLTTDLINKFSAYWKSLSQELKSSIAMWSMVAGSIATLVAGLPVLISIVSAVIGAFTALLSPIALVGLALVGIGVYLSGVAEAGITMEKRITRAVRAVLDVFSLMQTIVESIWQAIGPVFQDIVNGATDAFNWLMKQLGLTSEEGKTTGAELDSAFSNAMLKCMEYFTKFKTHIFTIIQSIASTWKSWTDNFALGLAAIAEKAGIVAAGTSKNLWEANNESRKKFDADQKKAMEDMEKSNKDAMDRMRERLNQNKNKADEVAGPLIKMFKGLQNGKGFQMKMNVSFEGLQGTFERLQQAFAQQVGPNIEQAQLGQLQGIHNNMQVAANALVNIKDKIPAVR